MVRRKSVDRMNSENLGTTLVRAQRVLITEGLWSSEASDKVWRLYQKGLTVKEIAERLFVTEKTVQAYLPYSKGYYSESLKSDDAIRSAGYRSRKQNAAESLVHYREDGEKMKAIKLLEETKNQFKSKELQESHGAKDSSVLKLHLELSLGYPNEEERIILMRYGRVCQGISRDILVRSDMTLHALHYAIQRAFGWENSHLHRFSFTTDIFNGLTGGTLPDEPHRTWTEQYDGSIQKWGELCGTYFRFPTEDLDDLYWDDDYNGEVSVKNWFRKKYTRNNYYGGDSEHFVIARRRARKFVNTHGERIAGGMTIADAGAKGIFEQCPNELLERLRLEEVLCPVGVKAPDQSILDKQRETRQALFEAANGKYDLDGIPKVVRNSYYNVDEIPWSEDDKRVLPVANCLEYYYDYGDGWEVKITCTDGYYIRGVSNDDSDDPVITDSSFISDDKEGSKGKVVPNGKTKLNCPEGSAVLAAPCLAAQRQVEEMIVYNIRDERIEGEEAADIAKVALYDKPECIAVDGLPVMDDVGGPYGYIDFLRELHEGDPTEREENREWARGMGWSGRMPKAKSVL